ncbi:MAG: prephenate dehydrogenase/arogenate dehydrogenase family protein [Pirellulaceae bacterium]
MHFNRAVIVGVGLLGGSVGLALRARSMAKRIVGWGRRTETLQQALDLHAIDEIETDLITACMEADLVVVCTPVQFVVPQVLFCTDVVAAGGLITDVGSTKRTICAELAVAARETFCGSHPLAGSEKSGVGFALADLFVGRLAVVTPSEQTPEPLAERTEKFWQALGSRTLRMTPQEHDCGVARTSHLPHVVASALAAGTPQALLP